MKTIHTISSTVSILTNTSKAQPAVDSIKAMKRITFLTLLTILSFISVSNAQLEKGNFMVGTDLGSGLAGTNSGLLGLNFGLDEDSGYSIGIAPKAGYFVADNFLLGGVINLGFINPGGDDSPDTFVYGIQALSRYYLTSQEVGVSLLKKGRFFVEANTGISGVNITDGPSTNGLALGFGPGYSYFVTTNVALETTLKYNGLVGFGDETYQNSLGLNIGLQIFVPTRKVNEVLNTDID